MTLNNAIGSGGIAAYNPMGPGQPNQTQIMYSPLLNTSGTQTISLPSVTSPISVIKAAVISMSLKFNFTGGGATATDLFPCTIVSKILGVGNYAAYFYLPIANSTVAGANYSFPTRSATVGSGVGIAIRHTTTGETYCVYANVTNGELFLSNNQWITFQAGINYNDLANSFIMINGCVLESPRLSTATTVIGAADPGVMPLSLVTTSTTSLSVSMSHYHASAFSTTKSTTLMNMCNELRDSSTRTSVDGKCVHAAAYADQWLTKIAVNASAPLVNYGTLGGTCTTSGTLAPTITTPDIDYVGYHLPPSAATGSRWIRNLFFNSVGTLDSTAVNTSMASPSLADGLAVCIFRNVGTNLTFSMFPILASAQSSATWNMYGFYMPLAGGVTIYGYGNVTGKTATYSAAQVPNNGGVVCAIIRWGRTVAAASTWASCNKIIQTNLPAGTAGSGTVYSGINTYINYTSYASNNELYFMGLWSTEQMTANPQIPWGDPAAITNMFYKNGGASNEIVGDPTNALGGVWPIVGCSPEISGSANAFTFLSKNNMSLMYTGGSGYYHRRLRTTPLIIGQV